MGGGTFFKVGITRARKKLWKNFVVWISNCDVTNIKNYIINFCQHL